MHRANPKKRPVPRLWLMTDERIDNEALIAAVARLPKGAGIVFRHYRLKRAERHALFLRVRAETRRRGILLLLAGSLRQAIAWRADGWHGHGVGHPPRPMLHSAPAHDVIQMRRAERAGADLLFVSPIFPTRSHPGAATLGPIRLAGLARRARRPVLALGGITARRASALKKTGIWGWGAIDGLIAES